MFKQNSWSFRLRLTWLVQFNDSDVLGEGTAWYASGNRYVGQWRNGKSHGEGIYYYATDARYEGQFDGGKCHGRGTYFYANGNK